MRQGSLAWFMRQKMQLSFALTWTGWATEGFNCRAGRAAGVAAIGGQDVLWGGGGAPAAAGHAWPRWPSSKGPMGRARQPNIQASKEGSACLIHLVLPATAPPSPDVRVPVHAFRHRSGLLGCKNSAEHATAMRSAACCMAYNVSGPEVGTCSLQRNSPPLLAATCNWHNTCTVVAHVTRGRLATVPWDSCPLGCPVTRRACWLRERQTTQQHQGSKHRLAYLCIRWCLVGTPVVPPLPPSPP